MFLPSIVCSVRSWIKPFSKKHFTCGGVHLFFHTLCVIPLPQRNVFWRFYFVPCQEFLYYIHLPLVIACTTRRNKDTTSIIIMNNTTPPHKGRVTHHQLQSIVPVSFKMINTIPRSVNMLIPDFFILF